ncbi:hypothetical protein EC991_001310 [Linnemannia zychae]|nr:hypothetical protein EC991_001310 [Linnemannia zychae]
MASSDTASTSTSNQLQDTDMTVRVKIEPEAPPTVAQLTQLATNLSLVNVKEEPLDDATNNTQLTTLQATIPSEPELSYHEQPEIVIPQDTHYFVIRVTDEGDFLDARKSNVWPTNPLYDKALRQLYSPTSRIFLIFTVFMSNGFCGIARMASEMMWVGERTIFDKSLLRQKFKLEWVACSYVSYDSVKMVTHEPVYKIIRKTGYKLTTEMGSAIHKILVENQPKEDPQLTLSLQTEISDFSALDTNLSQATLMDRGREHRDDSLLQISALPRDTSNMDDDIQKEQMPTVLGEKEDDDAKRTSSSTMDLDSDPGIDMVAFPRSTPPRSRSPLVRKRSISADEDTDLSTEKQLAYEDQLTRGRSPERGAERADLQTEEVEEYPHPPTRHHSPPSPRKISPPPPTKNRSPPPARNRSPPPARNRSPPPARNRSPPPARNRSPPPPRRNRPPPPPSQRSSSLPRRRSPPPYRQPAYDRAGSSTSTSSYGTSGTFRSTPPFPQRSKDPRDRSSTVYVFHTGSSPSHQRDQFNAPTDPRLSGRAIIPQKRPFDGSPAAVDSKDGGVLSEEVDMPASVFPLEDDFDEDFSVGGTGAGPSSSSSSSLSSAMVVRSHSAAVMSEAPPPQIKSITLVPAGMSKSRRKKLRKEALSKPLDF